MSCTPLICQNQNTPLSKWPLKNTLNTELDEMFFPHKKNIPYYSFATMGTDRGTGGEQAVLNISARLRESWGALILGMPYNPSALTNVEHWQKIDQHEIFADV